MTFAEIKAFLFEVIDDTIDNDFAYSLLENAKNILEMTEKPEILKTVSIANTTTANSTYLTAITLPADYVVPLERHAVFINQQEIFQVPLELREIYKDDNTKFYINYGTGQFFLCGTHAAGQTITFNYIKATTVINSANSTSSPVWPVQFHRLIAFDAADLYSSGIDSDELSFRMSDSHRAQQSRLRAAFKTWDHTLKLAAMGGRAMPHFSSPYPMQPKDFQA